MASVAVWRVGVSASKRPRWGLGTFDTPSNPVRDRAVKGAERKGRVGSGLPLVTFPSFSRSASWRLGLTAIAWRLLSLATKAVLLLQESWLYMLAADLAEMIALIFCGWGVTMNKAGDSASYSESEPFDLGDNSE
jgi:hypothetical protein